LGYIIWELEQHALTLNETFEFKAFPIDVSLSTDNHYLAVLDANDHVYVVDLQKTDTAIDIDLPFEGSAVNIFNAANSIIVGSSDGMLASWDFRGNELFSIKAHAEEIHSIVSNSHQLVTAGIDNSLKVWELN
jgi:WD40 repeat protein